MHNITISQVEQGHLQSVQLNELSAFSVRNAVDVKSWNPSVENSRVVPQSNCSQTADYSHAILWPRCLHFVVVGSRIITCNLRKMVKKVISSKL